MNAGSFELLRSKPSTMLVSDPERSVRMFRAVVWLFPLRPGMTTLSRFCTAGPPTPRMAWGVILLSPPELVLLYRHSAPVLNACLPAVQLILSPSWYEGLIVQREAPAFELQFMKFSVESSMIGVYGTPLFFGTSLNASAPSGPVSSLSLFLPTYIGAQLNCRPTFLATRSSFTRVDDSVDTSDPVYIFGQRLLRPLKPSGHCMMPAWKVLSMLRSYV